MRKSHGKKEAERVYAGETGAFTRSGFPREWAEEWILCALIPFLK